MYDYSDSYDGVLPPWYEYTASNLDVIRTISIADGITRIGNQAFSPRFRGDHDIAITHISNTLTEIGYKAFYWSNVSGELVLPGTLEQIGQSAFGETCIAKITIPANCLSVGDNSLDSYYTYNPFEGCEKLESIVVDTNNTMYCAVDGALYNKDMSTLIAYPLNKDADYFAIPSSVTSIAFGAFGDHSVSKLKTLEIPAGITFTYDIEEIIHAILALEAYVVDSENPSYCSVDGVLYSKDMSRLVAYPNGKKDENFVIPGNVITADGAFQFINTSPHFLKHITISKSMSNVDALRYLKNLESVNVDSDSAYFCSKEDILFSKDGKTLVWYPAQKQDVTYRVPEAVEVIGHNAFEQCSYLETLYLSDSVEKLESSSIVSCHKLAKVFLGENIDYIDTYSFSHTNSIGLFFMGNAPAFFGKNTIDPPTIYFIDGKSNWSSPVWVGSDGTPYRAKVFDPDNISTDDGANEILGNCGQNLWWLIADNVLTIGGTGTMASCGQGKFPWSSYGEYFSNVIIQPGVTSIAPFAFSDLSAMTAIQISDTVTQIGSYAFWYCTGLESIYVPANVTSIGISAFSFCWAMTDVTVAANNNHYTSVEGVLYNKDKTTIIHFPKNSEFKSYVIPDTVTTIGEYAFVGTDLSEISIPDTVNLIGARAFWNCGATFERIVIPASVRTIGDYAFQYSGFLKDVYFMGDLPSMFGAAAIGNCSSELTIHYVSGKVGWTSPSWTAPDGSLYRTEAINPNTIVDVDFDGSENIVCVIDNSAADFTQMIVGAYDTISGQLLGSAVGEYDGLSNTITVAFDIDLPESFELNVFCTDNNLSPQYKVSQFVIGE